MASRDAVIAEIPRLRRYARALTGDATLADDLVQDTLERALSRWRLFGIGLRHDLRAWLFSVMHNLFINQARRPHLVDYLPGEDDALAWAKDRPRQEDALELRDLERALARLPVAQRAVLLLVGLEDMSYAEVARVLDIPLGTVMSRLARGREQLRRELDAGAHPSAVFDLNAIRIVK
jgi:RNA polymerase sigma-70 factor (ECF subfamily)